MQENKIDSKDEAFENMIEDRMNANMADARNLAEVSNPKLRDLNKKLPDWNLEPPYAFLSDR